MKLFRSRSKNKDKNTTGGLALDEGTIDKLSEIKQEIESVSGKEISNSCTVDKIVNCWYIIYAVLEDENIARLMSKDDYESIRNVLFPDKFNNKGEDSLETSGISKAQFLYKLVEDTSELLIKDGSESLENIDDIIDTSDISEIITIDNYDNSIHAFATPGIIVSIDRDRNIVNIHGTEKIKDGIDFLDKAIKRGRANQDRTDDIMDRRYKARSYLFRRYRDMSMIEGLAHRVISFDSPRSIKGKAIILQLIKDNPEAFYEANDFYMRNK